MALRTIAFVVASAVSSAQTLPQIIAGNSQTQILALLLTNSGLNPALSGPGPFTVFGPEDSAFTEELGPNGLDFASNPYNAASNSIVLQYHVAPSSYNSSQLSNGQVIATLDPNETVTVSIVGSSISINTARVVTADLNATNGFLHVLDGVLIPPNAIKLPSQDLIAYFNSNSDLSTFLSLVVTAGLVSELSCTPQICNPFAVFAPDNEAFAALPPYFLNYLSDNPSILAEVISYHILNHRLYTPQIFNNFQAATLDVYTVVFVRPLGTYGDIFVNGVANITDIDIQTENGVVQVIDTVLIPNNIQASFDSWMASKTGDNSSSSTAPPAAPSSSPPPSASNSPTPTLSVTQTPTVTATDTPIPKTLAQWVESNSALTTLWKAIVSSELVKIILEGPGPFTLLAPTDAAFALLPQTYVAYLFANPSTALSSVLAYNILPFELVSNSTVNGSSYITVQGQNITATITSNGTFFNADAEVVSTDSFASNGVAKETSAVLLPVATYTPSQSPTQTMTPSQRPSGPVMKRAWPGQ